MRGSLAWRLCILSVVICLPACGSKSGGNLNPTEERLSRIGRAYVTSTYRIGHAPASFQDIKQDLGPDVSEDLLVSPRDGENFVILWGIDYNKIRPPSRDNPFVVGGYEKNGANGTRYVLCFPMGVTSMTDEQFQKANFPPGHKAP
jgi:hypothetical protein